VPPQALFYNLFACSACRFTDIDDSGETSSDDVALIRRRILGVD